MDIRDVLDQQATLENHLDDPSLTEQSRELLTTQLDQLRRLDYFQPPAHISDQYGDDWGYN